MSIIFQECYFVFFERERERNAVERLKELEFIMYGQRRYLRFGWEEDRERDRFENNDLASSKEFQ